MSQTTYTPIIGMEIHVELKTKSKMFCGCTNDPFHAPKPNIYTCPVCLGLPGGLPVPNKKAIEWTLMLGQALNCTIPLISKFDRKNYFYPDLPKGYQISQYDEPFAVNGYLEIDGQKIGITRVHLEEDTGKLIHAHVNGEDVTLIDFNRSSVPLVEIVTEPDIHTSDQAKKFLQELHLIIKYLGISDADMEKGSMRLEPNISLKLTTDNLQHTTGLPNYKVEVKNINSFNFVKKAIEALERRERLTQETRGWNEDKNQTYTQRSKEEAHDYRYFPDPDLPPLEWTQEYLTELKQKLPELPAAKRARLVKEEGLKTESADVLVNDADRTTYFEKSLHIVRQYPKEGITPQEIANWIINNRIDIAKEAPQTLIDKIRAKRQQSEIPTDTLTSAITKVLENNPKGVADYKKGKTNVLMFLVGQVLRETRGKGSPAEIKKLLIKSL